MNKMNPMKQIRIEKLTLNVGAGKDQKRLEKGMKLLKTLTGIEPVKTTTNKRIPAWGLRPGLPIGCKITLRKGDASELLKRLLESKDQILSESNFDSNGNISFGIHEYIDIPGIKYDPEIGVFGFQVCVTLERPGYRVKKRRVFNSDVGKKHIITKDESIKYMQDNFQVKIGDDN